MSKLNHAKLTTARLPSDVLALLTLDSNSSTKLPSPFGISEVDGQVWLGWLRAGYFWSGPLGMQIAEGVSIAQLSMPTSLTIAPCKCGNCSINSTVASNLLWKSV